MRSGYRRLLDGVVNKFESIYRKRSYRKKARVRLKRMGGGYNCTNEYKSVVVPFWAKYGYIPDKMWYQIYCDREKKIDPRYIPDDLWYGKIVPYFSNPQFRRFGEDKCYHDIWFPELKRPQTIAKNIAGIYYDANMNVITKEQVVKICLAYKGDFLIKPSIDSGEGRLIKFFSHNDTTIDSLDDDITNMESNFIIQAVVEQDSVLASFNESSLNTIRVVSFLFDDKVHILSTILRIGAAGSKVDNVGAGGFACPIRKNGTLNEKGVNRKAEWISETSSGKKFAGVEIPSYEKILRLIEEQHKRIPHFKLIGWDFCIDKEGDPVFIEFNTCPGANQHTCGPTFGEMTEDVLKEVFIEKKYASAQN